MTAPARREIGRLAVGGAAVRGCRRRQRRTGPRVAPFTSSNADVSVYTLMKLLGHESTVTSQRYDTAVRVRVSRPFEHCEGCPALAGVRNLGLDDPAVSRPDLHCNFEDQSIGCVDAGGQLNTHRSRCP